MKSLKTFDIEPYLTKLDQASIRTKDMELDMIPLSLAKDTINQAIHDYTMSNLGEAFNSIEKNLKSINETLSDDKELS